MTRPYVQVVADGAGKKIDNQFVTDDDGTQTTYRQVVVLGDSNSGASLASIGRDGTLSVSDPALVDLLTAVLIELRVLNIQIQATLNGRDDLDQLRQSLGG